MVLTLNYTFLYYQIVACWRQQWGQTTSLYLAMFLVVLMRCWDSYMQLACLNQQCWFLCMHAHNKSLWCLFVVCTHSSIFVVPSRSVYQFRNQKAGMSIHLPYRSRDHPLPIRCTRPRTSCLDTPSAPDARIMFISELPSVASTGSILKQRQN